MQREHEPVVVWRIHWHAVTDISCRQHLDLAIVELIIRADIPLRDIAWRAGTGAIAPPKPMAQPIVTVPISLPLSPSAEKPYLMIFPSALPPGRRVSNTRAFFRQDSSIARSNAHSNVTSTARDAGEDARARGRSGIRCSATPRVVGK